MKNFDHSVEINHNPNWPYFLDHPYRVLIFDGSRSEKANMLLNLIKTINDQILIEFIYMSIYMSTIHFVDYLQTIVNVYQTLEDYFPPRKRRMLIVFDDMIELMIGKT